MKAWEDVERELLADYFVMYDESNVRQSDDLETDGYIDSLGAETILAIFEDAGGKDYTMAASPADFKTLGTLRALYER